MKQLDRCIGNCSIMSQSSLILAGTIFIVAMLNGLLFIALVVHPSVDQSARDFSELLVNSARSVHQFDDGSSGNRDFITSLLTTNQLVLGDHNKSMQKMDSFDPYLIHLRDVLRDKTQNSSFSILTSIDKDNEIYHWVDLDMDGKTVRIGFSEQRSHLHFGWSLILLFVLWTLFTLAGTVLASRKITQPIRNLERDLDAPDTSDGCCIVTERGPLEIRSLTRKTSNDPS